ncbi:hypothetical protein HDU85_005065 [Gaertneriomyces sp. JEL0708]|nr:hypothetical protein HDU85_005065 [Gaertneriomyces sp. JEL0708]
MGEPVSRVGHLGTEADDPPRSVVGTEKRSPFFFLATPFVKVYSIVAKMKFSKLFRFGKKDKAAKTKGVEKGEIEKRCKDVDGMKRKDDSRADLRPDTAGVEWKSARTRKASTIAPIRISHTHSKYDGHPSATAFVLEDYSSVCGNHDAPTQGQTYNGTKLRRKSHVHRTRTPAITIPTRNGNAPNPRVSEDCPTGMILSELCSADSVYSMLHPVPDHRARCAYGGHDMGMDVGKRESYLTGRVSEESYHANERKARESQSQGHLAAEARGILNEILKIAADLMEAQGDPHLHNNASRHYQREGSKRHSRLSDLTMYDEGDVSIVRNHDYYYALARYNIMKNELSRVEMRRQRVLSIVGGIEDDMAAEWGMHMGAFVELYYDVLDGMGLENVLKWCCDSEA